MLSSSRQTACFEPPLRSNRRGGFVGGSNEVAGASPMISRWRLRRAGLFAALAIVVLVVLAYSNHFHNGFQFDDAHTVVNNAFIQELGTFRSSSAMAPPSARCPRISPTVRWFPVFWPLATHSPAG